LHFQLSLYLNEDAQHIARQRLRERQDVEQISEAAIAFTQDAKRFGVKSA
jgi:hypothetical protein